MRRIATILLLVVARVAAAQTLTPPAPSTWSNTIHTVPAPNVPTYNTPQPATTTPNIWTPADPYAPPPPPAPRAPFKPIVPSTMHDVMTPALRRPTVTAPNTVAGVPQPKVLPSVPTPVIETPAPVARGKDERILISAPVMFDTPEADAIVSKLQIFPPDSPWHQDVRDWPAHPQSANIIGGIGAGRQFTYNLDMAFVLVPAYQGRREVQLTTFASESDPGPYPVPDNLPIEGWPAWYRRAFGKDITLEEVQRDARGVGGDRHAIVVDPINRLLYEFFAMRASGAGWTAAQASIFDLKSNKQRPAGWASADAAGLPIFPAVVRYDELMRGEIDHALRVTVPETRKAYVAPARHYASDNPDPNLPRMGERLRLRRDYDVSTFAPEVRTILIALKMYGMFVADNGRLFAISVAPDERMPDTLGQLEKLRASDFEVVTRE